MYTVKIKSVSGASVVNGDKIRSDIKRLLNSKLEEHAITVAGVHEFLGERSFLTLSSFKKGDGNLRYEDWLIVNKAINEVLDELEVVAFVRAPQYIVRTEQGTVRNEGAD